MKHAVVIGSGLGGLGIACILSKQGYRVTVLEKNNRHGGRAGVFEQDGYRFDMGPSWYLMPDVFERFFDLIGEPLEQHLTLKKLTPSYRIYFSGDPVPVDIEAQESKARILFESYEVGAGEKLHDYLAKSGYQYGIAIREFMYKNYDSVLDFFTKRTIVEGRKLSVLSTMDRYVKKFFRHPRLQKILQYQLVFLGSSPYETPALYNVMNHIDFSMGVYYPEGGIAAIPQALVAIAEKHGVTLRTGAEVTHIHSKDGVATGVELNSGEVVEADLVISDADLAWTETKLLSRKDRTYSERYWKKRTLAPSAFILYLGVDGPIDSLTHHTLLFAEDWKKNFDELFKTPGLPQDPSLYICNPSKTDSTVAPKGKENLFVLVPIGAGREYSEAELDAYQEKVLSMIEKECAIPNLRARIEVSRRYGPADFVTDYHSLGGTGLGLAHTLSQTSAFRPNNVSGKVKNLYYVGANTNPGIGMPTCLISAELAWKRIAGITDPAPMGKSRYDGEPSV
jgi:phytoene desaturase